MQLHARRGLFIVGQLVRFGSKLVEEAQAQPGAKDPVSVRDILSTFLRYLDPKLDLQDRVAALQASGFMLIAQPQLILLEDRRMDSVRGGESVRAPPKEGLTGRLTPRQAQHNFGCETEQGGPEW